MRAVVQSIREVGFGGRTEWYSDYHGTRRVRWIPDRIVNVHPSLLPAFPGAHPVEDQLAAGVRESGATVHLVDEGVDSGPILGSVEEPQPSATDAPAPRTLPAPEEREAPDDAPDARLLGDHRAP